MVWAGNLTKVPGLDLYQKYEQSVNKAKKSLTTSNRRCMFYCGGYTLGRKLYDLYSQPLGSVWMDLLPLFSSYEYRS